MQRRDKIVLQKIISEIDTANNMIAGVSLEEFVNFVNIRKQLERILSSEYDN